MRLTFGSEGRTRRCAMNATCGESPSAKRTSFQGLEKLHRILSNPWKPQPRVCPRLGRAVGRKTGGEVREFVPTTLDHGRLRFRGLHALAGSVSDDLEGHPPLCSCARCAVVLRGGLARPILGSASRSCMRCRGPAHRSGSGAGGHMQLVRCYSETPVQFRSGSATVAAAHNFSLGVQRNKCAHSRSSDRDRAAALHGTATGLDKAQRESSGIQDRRWSSPAWLVRSNWIGVSVTQP